MNEKPWARASEVCRTLEYQKGSARDVLKKHVSIENKQHRHGLDECAAVAPPTISIMICHVMSRGYNDIKGKLN